MVYGILCELLKVAIPDSTDVNKHIDLDISQLSDGAVFSVQLYHQWYVLLLLFNLSLTGLGYL